MTTTIYETPDDLPINIQLVIDYYALFQDQDPMNPTRLYSFTGSVAANTEAAWLAVVWTDTRTQPTYAQIVSDNWGIVSGVRRHEVERNSVKDAVANIASNSAAISAISTTISGKANVSTVPKVYFGTTLQAPAIVYANHATVASGVAVFQMTADGLSTGTALFPTGPNLDTLNCFVSDATASYQMAGALSNSNKTLTVTANKLTTASILTGILGQTAANGAVVKVQIMGN